MQPYIVHVRLQDHGRAPERIVRYAVLAATAAEALEAVSGGLAFGDRASVSDDTLTYEQAQELALVAGKARMIE